MELSSIIQKLHKERAKLDVLIASLEQLEKTISEVRPILKKRRGRKFMDEAGRKEVSERMKKYWADRRRQKGTIPSSGEGITTVTFGEPSLEFSPPLVSKLR